MTILYKVPGEEAHELVIINELHLLQQLVGGYIEIVPLFGDLVAICDEEGKLKGKPGSGLILRDPNGRPYNEMVGNVIICRTDGEELVGLNPEDIRELKERMPELWRA